MDAMVERGEFVAPLTRGAKKPLARAFAVAIATMCSHAYAQANEVSQDIEPFAEYRADVYDGPDFFSTDMPEAAGVLVRNECAQRNYSNCRITGLGEGAHAYQAFYLATLPTGETYTRTTVASKYYACHNPPALYIITPYAVMGPYPNRSRIVGTTGGEVVCRYGTEPELPDPDTTPYQADLGPGDCTTRPSAGNPLNIGLGNKYQEVVDIAATGGSPLVWHRYYNSGIAGEDARRGEWTVPTTAALGARWRGTYDRALSVLSDDASRVRLLRHTGERIDFVEESGRYVSAVDSRGQLRRVGGGWTYRAASGQPVETYDAQGRLVAMGAGTSQQVTLRYTDRLVAIVDAQGRQLTVAYDAVGRMASVSDGNGVVVTYTYAGPATGKEAHLVRATYADGTFHEYLYNETGFAGGDHPHVLTGIYDETKQRFATFRYDSDGRAIASEHWNGVGKVQLAREAGGTVAVTGPMGAVHRYRYADVRGSRRLVSVDQPGGAGCAAASSRIEYDGNGLVSRRVDFDGQATEYRYDSDGNEIERSEATGTPSVRTIATTWHPTLGLPTRITAPGREERFSYDGAGNLTGRETWAAIDPTQPGAPLTLSRIWRFTYDADGRLAHEEGPRSDRDTTATVARYTYRGADAANCATGACDYRKGDLWKSENALGQVEEALSYDPAGRVRSRKDAQGTVFTYTYGPRGWLDAVTETRPGGIVATTAFTYTPRGDIASVTDADGITLRFEYDNAGRLIQVANPSNHRLRFTLDAAGQRREEATYDLLLRTQLSRTFDALGRIETETREGAVTRFTYDERGRPTSTTDADNRKDTASYDALGRLREVIRDVGGIGAISKARYDPLNQLTAIEDPKGLSTRYLTTGLGDVGSVDSPDAGLSTDEHDATGLVIRHEGAGGVGSYRVTRDALGRPTLVHYDGGLDALFAYDVADTACPADQRHAKGRLASMTQGSSRTVYCYDAPGHVTRTIQRWATTTKTVSYRYSKAGRLEAVGIDGGAETTYRYDADGSMAGVTVTPAGGARADLITSVAYRPFDLIESWRYGNGGELRAARDKSGRVTSWSSIDPANSLYVLGYTPGGEIASQFGRWYGFTLGHDGLGYLDTVKDFSSGSPLRSFEYTNTGDRTAMTAGGVRQTYLYDPASHRLTTADGKARRYDAAGNTIGIGDATLTYDDAGRLASASEQGRVLVTYGYDADGQRIARTETGKSAELWLYDEQGRWLADYDTSGKVTRQAVWMGDYLVGLVEGTKVYYVEPDHLGTPRAVIDPARNATVWRWRPSDDPFGTAPPDEDPDGDGARFVFDLRFPGQRYDAVTGLHYNYRRDYDPEAGRYIQVDPIGLAGGINPYLYGSGSPLRYTDPLGLYAGIDDLVFTTGGALVGVIGQGFSDLLSGRLSGWEDYAGSAIGGAVSGEALLYTGPVGAGIAGGAATNFSKQALRNLSKRQCGFNLTSLAADSAVGGITGFIPGTRVAGITAGRNSMNSIFRQMKTKFRNGTISTVTFRTALKMGGGRAVDTAVVPGMAAGSFAGTYLGPVIPGYVDDAR
ncbi:RHS repeat-associated core domain-containing protein [Luteibacter yeojuensis]|uniref:RHS repeat protein n=1 Tax=Luteibacter yeojuensis TaxID=345309 RepID=A0A7X5TQH0_9GAMM|nr:RHS repeat-associated core domain-containing protein [Luteibacter yeojuensis]NID15497.1 RHS repeat protein [Luteibacter yeojuensis]